MNNFLKNIQKIFKKNDAELPVSTDNSEIINTYHKMRDEWKLIPADEPNYALARKVFLDFNDFNLKNLNIHRMYLDFVPQSLLPYPKNYIKCAYYIYLESLKKENDLKMFKLVEEIGIFLFIEYPNFEEYQKNLEHKSGHDDVVFKDGNPFNGRIPREEFKKLYGTYQILKEQYDNSPSSIDATDEKLIYDFGVLPEIEADIDIGKMVRALKT